MYENCNSSYLSELIFSQSLQWVRPLSKEYLIFFDFFFFTVTVSNKMRTCAYNLRLQTSKQMHSHQSDALERPLRRKEERHWFWWQWKCNFRRNWNILDHYQRETKPEEHKKSKHSVDSHSKRNNITFIIIFTSLWLWKWVKVTETSTKRLSSCRFRDTAKTVSKKTATKRFLAVHEILSIVSHKYICWSYWKAWCTWSGYVIISAL